MPRAGSTLLARELDRCEGLAVGIEESLPDGIVWGEPVKIHSRQELDHYLEQVYRDEKIRAWGVDKMRLREKLLTDHALPLEFSHVLVSLLLLYFGDRAPGCVIHKKGPYFRHIEKVRTLFPGSGIIFMERDPRAVYNSQKQALRSKTGDPMAESLSTFVFQYLESQQIIKRYLSKDFFCRVSYEDLLADPSGVIARLLDFLELPVSRFGDGSYQSRIPSAQRHLHENLGKDMIGGRVDAWKQELGADEIYFLQKALKRTLRNKGYGMRPVRWREVPNKTRVALRLIHFYFKHTFKRLAPGSYQRMKRLLKRRSVSYHEQVTAYSTGG
jgi:hypothetical protein